MNKKAIEIDQVDGQEDDQHVDENAENEQPLTAEDIARQGGWKPLEEWDGDPKEWRSAEVFNERGEWIQRHKAQERRINELQDDFNTRLSNVTQLHQIQLEAQKAELIRKRDEAIDLADKDAALGYQSQLEKLDQTPVQPEANKGQQVLDEWNKENPWIFGNDPKAAYAKQQFALYESQGNSVTEAIRKMEADVEGAFAKKPPTPEGGSRPGSKRSASKLSWGDLTSDEVKYYRSMPNAWESEAAFLQAVQDSRSAS